MKMKQNIVHNYLLISTEIAKIQPNGQPRKKRENSEIRKQDGDETLAAFFFTEISQVSRFRKSRVDSETRNTTEVNMRFLP